MAEAEGVVDKEGAAAVGKKRARDEVPTAPIADELQLPHASIMRIVKSKLPAGMMVGTDTKKTLSKACSLFVLYLTTIANDIAKEGGRTTVNAADVLHAMRDLEFDEFITPVEASLAAFRETEKARSIEAAAKRAAAQTRAEQEGEGEGADDGDGADEEAGAE